MVTTCSAATAQARCSSSPRRTSKTSSSPVPTSRTTSKPELERVVRFLAENRWPFRLHATYDESISRFLGVFEKVNRDVPLEKLHWFFDHCETISDRNIERVKALGGGIAVQHRMAFQGEYFVERYGAKAAERTPPLRRMLEMGVPVSAGTDATRVASYNPFVSLYWMTHRQDPRRPLALSREGAAHEGRGPSALHPGRHLDVPRGRKARHDRSGTARRPRRADGGLLRRPRRGDQGRSSRCSRSSAASPSTPPTSSGRLDPLTCR